MTQSSLLMKLRRSWPLVLAIMALIIAIAFNLIMPSVEDRDIFGKTVDYWETINKSISVGARSWFCAGFWLILPFMALIAWLRRREAVSALITFASMLLAAMLMCYVIGLYNPNNFFSDSPGIPSLQDYGTVPFDNHIYHLALYDDGSNIKFGSYVEFVLFECDVSDTECHLYRSNRDFLNWLRPSSNAKLVVDSVLNQLKVIVNGEIVFTLNPSTTASP